MANLDFYAVAEDQRDLVRFLFSETDVVIYEMASRCDHDVRHFGSLAELEAVFSLGAYRTAYLQLWSPSVIARPVIRRIALTAVPGHSFRYNVEGAGLIQLYLDGIQDGIIYHTHYGHFSESGARAREIQSADDCDWHSLSKLSGRIQRHIRGRLSSAKLYARPVLRHAFGAIQQGAGLWFGPEIHRADSADIKSHVA